MSPEESERRPTRREIVSRLPEQAVKNYYLNPTLRRRNMEQSEGVSGLVILEAFFNNPKRAPQELDELLYWVRNPSWERVRTIKRLRGRGHNITYSRKAGYRYVLGVPSEL